MEILNCFMKGTTRLRSASTLTATTTKFRSLYVSYIFWTIGSSCLHGPHHVAQTFKSTTLPFSCERRTLPPSDPTNSRSGKVGGDCDPDGCARAAGARATAAARARRDERIRIIERSGTGDYSVAWLRSG